MNKNIIKVWTKNGCYLCNNTINYVKNYSKLINKEFELINISNKINREKYYENFKFKVPTILVDDKVILECAVDEKIILNELNNYFK